MPRRNEEVVALTVIEREHANLVACSERAITQGLYEVGRHIELGSFTSKKHRGGNVHNDIHWNGDALKMQAHQPLRWYGALARAQIEPPWVWIVEQPSV